MNFLERKHIIAKYKKQIIRGTCLELIPFSAEHCTQIVALRNQNRSRFYLNQEQLLTVPMQLDWYNQYSNSDNDVYWCIYDKHSQFIGTIRLYNIELDGSVCDQGSFIIDETYAKTGPFALEAELRSLQVAFDVLEINKVRNSNRLDNKNMNSISKRIGFVYVGDTSIRDVTYKQYELTKDKFNYKPLEDVLQYWEKR